MRFQILHESPGRMRLRAEVRSMSLHQADLLEGWLRAQPDIDEVKVHERTCGVTVIYHGERAALCRIISGFTYEKAEQTVDLQTRSSRAMNREYKEKLVFLVIRHYLKRFFLPVPFRRAITICQTIPRFVRAASVLASGRLTVDVLDGVAIGASLLTGDHQVAGSVHFLLNVGETLDEWTHKKSVEDLAKSMSLQVDQVWRMDEDGRESIASLDSIVPGDRIVVHTGHVLPLDGILEDGDVMLNQASLTGESVPVSKHPGAVFFAAGVFYYFRTEDVRKMFSAMAEHFPGAVLAFDSCSERGAKLMRKTWLKEAGITDVSAYFSLEDEAELRGWSDLFASVTAKSYMRGYRDIYRNVGWVHRLMIRFCDTLVKMKIVKILFRK